MPIIPRYYWYVYTDISIPLLSPSLLFSPLLSSPLLSSPLSLVSLLTSPSYGGDDCYYGSNWDRWGRWVAFAVIVGCAFILFFGFA